MPRVLTADRQQYERARQERRRTDPEYKRRRNARARQRYAEDPEYRAWVRAYQSAYRKRGGVDLNTRRTRIARGMTWTPAEEAAFIAATVCEVCGGPPTKRGLFADHCHDCRRYRGPLCHRCNADEGVLRKWGAVCPPGSPMRIYMDRHACEGVPRAA